MVPEPTSCRIPEHLHAIGQTQAWLAAQTGFSTGRISDYANLKRIMSYQTAYMIAKLLRVRMEDLYDMGYEQLE